MHGRVLHSSHRNYYPHALVQEKEMRFCTVSPNKSLQRSGRHKVLGRGRGLVTLASSFARPRADKSACGR